MSNTTYKSKVGYQSPIKLNQTLEWEEGTADKISKYIAGEIDNLILESCVKVGCDVNEEELIKALQYDRGQYEKGYADGKRDAQPHWVSVEERLPEKNGAYLVFIGYGHNWIWFKDIFMDGKFMADTCALNGAKVTHWMPIEPPKEDE